MSIYPSLFLSISSTLKVSGVENPVTSIIEIKVEGEINLTDMKKIFVEAVQLATKKDTFLFLADYREATINLSVSDIYELPTTLANTTTPLGVSARNLKRAIVFSPKTFGDAAFAEDVTTNHGQIAKFFQDVDEAKNWLLKK